MGPRSFWWRVGPALAYIALIVALSARPGRPATPYGTDKLLHLLEYAVLGMLLLRAAGAPRSPGAALGLAALATLVGLADEGIQHLVPGRESPLADVAADAGGAALGIWAGRHVPGLRRRGEAGARGSPEGAKNISRRS